MRKCLVLTEVDITQQPTMGISAEFRVAKVYSEAMKKEVVFRVLSGELRKADAKREYGISGHGTLDQWLERYGRGILSEHKQLLEGMGTPKKRTRSPAEVSEAEELRRRMRELERELEAATLRAEAYSLMIDLAEKELKVAIRKKSDTK